MVTMTPFQYPPPRRRETAIIAILYVVLGLLFLAGLWYFGG